MKKLYKEEKDAYYNKEPFEIHPEVYGIDFDVEEANNTAIAAKTVEEMNDKSLVAPSHDAEGDCATTLALRFTSKGDCEAFAYKCEKNGLSVTIPINTGKHIYTNWTQIMEKRGAHHPSLDPFKMKENQGLQMNYSMDMCPNTLDYLERTAYINLNPDWTNDDIERVANIINI